MKYTLEEVLFNQSFKYPFMYIFTPSTNYNQFILTEFVSQNPLRVRAVDVADSLSLIISKGKMLSIKNGIHFIENEVYTPIL